MMTIQEVFPNPTVKQVIFQIRYPNLFFMENKIGDFQLKIMKMFPESSLAFQKKFVFASLGPAATITQPPETEEPMTRKVWQFSSPERQCKLNVMTDSLDISSEFYKTYANESHPNKFRDVIEAVVKALLEVTQLPLILRLGLRYIDECPLPQKNNSVIEEYYNTTFPLKRFDLSLADEMTFVTTVDKGDSCKVRYIESLQKGIEGEYKLMLDFDGFVENIEANNYLLVCDRLHQLISNEYETTIKAPVYSYMRTGANHNG